VNLRDFRNEDGNVESVIVVIPLLFLFLGVLQIAAAALSHGIASNFLQGEISRSALYVARSPSQSLSAVVNPQDQSENQNVNRRFIELPGGGRIIIGTTFGEQIPIMAFALGHIRFQSKSIVIDEN
jgi:hypothetical protein